MKRKITISWSLFELLCFGIYPLWYWEKEHDIYKSLEISEKVPAGYHIYGFEIKLLGFRVTFGCATFNKTLRLNNFYLFLKNIEIN